MVDIAQEHSVRSRDGIRKEWPLAASIATMVLFFIFSKSWFEHLANPLWFTALFGWLFIVILCSAFAIVRHAETLAEHVGEPLGTLILTLAVTGLEVMMIAAVMYSDTGETTMARDAMFAVIMLVLNGMVGVSLVVGGLRYREQTYNLMGANAFLAVIVPLAVLGLVVPELYDDHAGANLFDSAIRFHHRDVARSVRHLSGDADSSPSRVLSRRGIIFG